VGRIFIDRLVVRGIIGVHESERKVPQEIVISLGLFTDVSRAGVTDDIGDCVDYQSVVEKVTAHAERAGRYTVESLATDIARIVLEERGVERVHVRVEKPGAIRSCQSVGVEIELIRDIAPACPQAPEVDRAANACENEREPERDARSLVEHSSR
jgi:FolB domain-containing protein